MLLKGFLFSVVVVIVFLIVLEGSQLVKMKSALVLILLGVCEKGRCQCYVDSG